MDDEPLALNQLTAYIKRVPYLDMVAACHDAYEANDVINREQVDAIFADINMPDLNGLEFIRSLSKPPLVVFTTAYSDYAIEGFRVNAIDYLMKPFSFDEFLSAAGKVQRQYELEHAAESAKVKVESPDFIYVRADHRMQRIGTDDILYIEGMSEYVRIYTATGQKPITTLLSMHKIEKTLPKDTFLRVHKSYIVNMSRIQSVNKTSILIDEDKYIVIGDAYRQDVSEYISRHALK